MRQLLQKLPKLRTVLILLASHLLWFAGCSKHPESVLRDRAVLPVVAVKTTAVRAQTEEGFEEIVGTVRAAAQATIEARIAGTIEKMPVVVGQKLAAGQLVALLSAPEIRARLEQAEAASEQASRDWKRASTLFEQQAATRAEFDAAQSRHRSAIGALTEARTMMSYLEVTAPFAGVVTSKPAAIGDQAGPGRLLIVLEDSSTLQLETDIPEAISKSVRAEGRMNVRVDGFTDDLVGVVTEVAPIADSASRTIHCKLRLPKGAGLSPGQFARVLVPAGSRNSLRIAGSAVVQRGQLEIVFAVENRRAQLRLVKTGGRFGNEVEILAGLKAGEVVAKDGAAGLADGQPVEEK